MSNKRYNITAELIDDQPCLRIVPVDDGGWVLHSDRAAELAEWKQRAERAEKYVAGQDVRSDFRTAAEMRAELEHARAELARVEGERDSIRNAVAEACMWSGCNSAKELREALDRNYKRATNAEKANTLLRAECEAWKHRYESKCPADAGTAAHTAYYTEAAKKLKEARAATDAAGILKGGAQ